jgi:hypothetical protein
MSRFEPLLLDQEFTSSPLEEIASIQGQSVSIDSNHQTVDRVNQNSTGSGSNPQSPGRQASGTNPQSPGRQASPGKTKQQVKEERLKLEYKYKEQRIAYELDEFYANDQHRVIFEEKLLPLMDSNDKAQSQRALEQFYTRIVRENNLCYYIPFTPVVYDHEADLIGSNMADDAHTSNNSIPKGIYAFNLLDVHDTQVINVQKRFANPFRRRDKFEYTTRKGITITTTVCQLKFFAPWIQFNMVDPLLQAFEKARLQCKKRKRGRKPISSSKSEEKSNLTTDVHTVVETVSKRLKTDVAHNQNDKSVSDVTHKSVSDVTHKSVSDVTHKSVSNVDAVSTVPTKDESKSGKKYYKNGPSMTHQFYVFEYPAQLITPFLPARTRVITRAKTDDQVVKQQIMNDIMYMDVSEPLSIVERVLSCRVIVSKCTPEERMIDEQ